MRTAAVVIAALALPVAPASAHRPVNNNWTVPLAVYASDPYITPWTLDEANSQMPQSGTKYEIIAVWAGRQHIPVEVLAGVYAVFSGLGTFRQDRFGLNETPGPPRATGSFRIDAYLAARELRRIQRSLYPQ